MPESRTRRPSTAAPRRRTARRDPEAEPRPRRRTVKERDAPEEPDEPDEPEEPDEEPDESPRRRRRPAAERGTSGSAPRRRKARPDEADDRDEEEGEDEEPDEGEEPDEEQGDDRDERQAGIGAAAAAARAATHVRAMTGRSPEGVTSLERTEEGWRIGVEVVESRRIPDTTDILAVYRVDLDRDGELLAYRREDRYHRGRTPDREEDP
ncbi:hypothetical protein GCM10009759_09140 [Kitasatospora saccharophila]|uniref:Gas vesicle protein GvpO n=1 Tax=Kitasatospora saccharophila TaxID=407973 RepID=A0ABN2WA09_9ACTN